MLKANDLIATLIIGTPARHRALSVYPLTCHAKSRVANYLVLDEALATGRFRITEVSEGGAVPLLLAVNDAPSPVFLLDGEELVGAKQNRVVNLSLMVPPKSRTEIPVSCVEAGRWRADSRAFRSVDRAHFARGRARKMVQVSHALHMCEAAISNQSDIWDEISAKSSRMGVCSPTGAMAEIFESRRGDLRGYLDAIPTRPGQIGAVYTIGDAIAGLEVFDAATTFGKVAQKLLSSYAVDAIEYTDAAEVPAVSSVQAFIDAVRSAPSKRFAVAGLGETVRFSTEGIVGAALEVEGDCVHLSAFPRQAFDDGLGAREPLGAHMQNSSLRGRRH
jgi:hypothetical protein